MDRELWLNRMQREIEEVQRVAESVPTLETYEDIQCHSKRLERCVERLGMLRSYIVSADVVAWPAVAESTEDDYTCGCSCGCGNGLAPNAPKGAQCSMCLIELHVDKRDATNTSD